MARRRDVDRLLEVRAVERVRLVEEREHLERAAAQEPLDRDLGARARTPRRGSSRAAVLLARRAAPARVLRSLAMRRHAATNPAGIVGPDDAAARREDERLQDAGVAATSRAAASGSLAERRGARKARHRHAGVAERLAHRVLVRGAARGLGRVVREPEPLRRERGDDRGRIARRDDAADRPRRRGLGDLLRRALRPAVVERDAGPARVAEGVLDLGGSGRSRRRAARRAAAPRRGSRRAGSSWWGRGGGARRGGRPSRGVMRWGGARGNRTATSTATSSRPFLLSVATRRQPRSEVEEPRPGERPFTPSSPPPAAPPTPARRRRARSRSPRSRPGSSAAPSAGSA